MDAEAGSRTARAVAVGRAVGVGGHRDPRVAALLPRTDRAAVRTARLLGAGRSRTASAWGAHAGLRMVAVDRAVETALVDSEAAALVVIGAGYDTRAHRLDAVRGRVVLEVDHPATQAAKQQGLVDDEPLAARHVFASADLRHDDLAAVLAGAGHDPGRPTVWLWEAVVPYLPEDAVDATLAVLRERSVPGSRLVLTTVRPGLVRPWVLGQVLAGPARSVMDGIGEPVRLAEPDADVVARLRRHGFAHRSVSGVARWAADADVRLYGPQLDERLHVAVAL